ncbi:hypothetical protein FOA52_002696 [Chlamydomonas sp. UWO 241]|nr:hypothetical protein FOA52_002696 [Chlamydomonas sp. UWO 241]
MAAIASAGRRIASVLGTRVLTHRSLLRALPARFSVTTAAGPSGNGHVEMEVAAPRNVLGGELKCCCTAPVTGYYRDGFCRTDESDHGRHVVCAQVTAQFLEYSASRGNDLRRPGGSFPGLKPGDKWCLCASRWKEALDAGCAPQVFLECTHSKALEFVTLESLQANATA